MKLGLALSGGGLRATFFHLGVVRYLREAGILPQVRYVTSVSGGSILAAHLVLNWSRYQDPSGFDEAARELYAVAAADLRGRILRRLPSHFPLTCFERTRRQRPRTIRNLLFEAYLERYLYGKATLSGVGAKEPEAPHLDVLATNLSRGTLAVFTAERFIPDEKGTEQIETETALAKAVAISAAFPGFFPPVEIDNETLGVDAEDFPTDEYLTDGGVYDNLGLRRFRTLLASATPPVDHVLVCNASGHFDWVIGREPLGLLKTALRSTEIFMKRLAELEGEVFSADRACRFTHLQLGDLVVPTPDANGGALSVADQQLLKNVRTDLDYFSPVETYALERHGYAMAGSKCGFLLGEKGSGAPGAARSWTHNVQVNPKDLQASRSRRLRFFSPKDGISYLHLLLLVLALLVPGWRLASSFGRERFLSSLASYHRDTFGMFELRSPAEGSRLLDRVAVAAGRWPRDPEIQVNTALASYSILNSGTQESDRCWHLLGEALRALERIPGIAPRQKQTYFQLKGHYLLAQGELFRRQGRAAAARKSYLAALDAYERFRQTAFHGLHGLEFNLCNTAVMVDRLDYALERCENSDRYAREERLNFWEAKAVAGRIYARKDNLMQAAANFHEAWEIAARASADEESRCKRFLKWEVATHPKLCGQPILRDGLRDLCDGLARPSPLQASQPAPAPGGPSNVAGSAGVSGR